MLIIVLLICMAVFLMLMIFRKDFLSVCFLGMSAANIAMIGGVVVYIAKMGGLAAKEEMFLFFTLEIHRWLQFLPISMDVLGYVVAVGRMLFPMFLFWAALDTSMIPLIRRKKRLLHILSVVPTVCFLIYYFPGIFRNIVRGHFWMLMFMLHASIGWITLCIVVSLILMLYEYHCTTIPVFRRNFGYMIMGFVSVTLLYILYATKDPAQIYNMFIGEYIDLGISSYIGPSLSDAEWMVFIIISIIFLLFGSFGIIRYAQIDYNEKKENLMLHQKFDATGKGVSVFVHGIKNQLISAQVLHKRLARELESEQPDMEEVRTLVAGLRELNEGMRQRMDELYRTVKDNALSLKPVKAETVITSAVQRFKGKYPDGKIELGSTSERIVLADTGPLSEVLYNLMVNGYEAAVQAGHLPPQVQVSVSEERLWTVIQVRDNGGGIPKNMQNKIFEPFYTSKNTNFNWGMGLYYVRKIVKSHLGHLRLESTEGEGSIFYVMLPLFDAVQKEEKSWLNRKKSE